MTPSDMIDILYVYFDVSDYSSMENLDTYAAPLQQVWVLDKQVLSVIVLPYKTLNMRNLEVIITRPVDISILDAKGAGEIVKIGGSLRLDTYPNPA